MSQADLARLTGIGVKQNARLLARYLHIETQLMRIQAGWLARIPEWEVKIALGKHLWDDTGHADMLRSRIDELRARSEPPPPAPSWLTALMRMAGRATDTATLLAGLYRAVKGQLIITCREHLDDTDEIADSPTVQVLRHMLVDEERHCAWAEALLGHLLADADTAGRALSWQGKLEAIFANAGGLRGDGSMVVPESDGVPPPAALPKPVRDSRFSVLPPGHPDVPGDAYNRDDFAGWLHMTADLEMQAAELLGRNIYENLGMPWPFHRDMARQCWDEVRHAELVARRLEALGGHMGQFPTSPYNYAYRVQLDLLHRLADLNLGGELSIMPDLKQWRDDSLRLGDEPTAYMLDYIHADEVQHVKFGWRWVRHLVGRDQSRVNALLDETRQMRREYESRGLVNLSHFWQGGSHPRASSSDSTSTPETL